MPDTLYHAYSNQARRLIVSIHDVTQHSVGEVSSILRDLEAIGITKTSLLVVPNYHRRGLITADAGANAWLHSLVRRGHEIVLHGYYHRRERRTGESLRDRLLTRLYTADEGEFFDISQFEAERRLRHGRQILREMGLSASGFVAPAWLLSDGAEKACRVIGFEYTVLFDGIVDLIEGRKTLSRSLVYSTRAAWRRLASCLYNPWLARHCRQHPVLRLSIHPPDHRHPRIWSQILRLAKAAAADREIATYIEQVMTDRRQPATKSA